MLCEELAPSDLRCILPGLPEESPLPVGLVDGCQMLGVRDQEQQQGYKGQPVRDTHADHRGI